MAKPIEEKKVEEIKVEPAKKKYWYYCDACSNEAFFSDSKSLYGARSCQKCGKVITVVKEENYIEMK